MTYYNKGSERQHKKLKHPPLGLLSVRPQAYIYKHNEGLSPIHRYQEYNDMCMYVFIPSPVRVGTLLMEVPGTPIGASFFEFELKPTEKDSADPTQHE